MCFVFIEKQDDAKFAVFHSQQKHARMQLNLVHRLCALCMNCHGIQNDVPAHRAREGERLRKPEREGKHQRQESSG